MRHIRKNNCNFSKLDFAHENPPTAQAQAYSRSRWKSFRYKGRLNELLNNEQYGLCAYSEVRADQLGLDFHIEHIEPKSIYPKRTFDYTNLVLSAVSSEKLKSVKCADIFGGHAKKNQYDPNLFVSPLQSNCSSYFIYLSNGRVEPANELEPSDHKKAEYTINLLNLNSHYLVNQRKNWLDELDAYIDEHIEQDWSLSDLALIYLVPVKQKLDPFFTATRLRFGSIAEKVLVEQYPELL